MQQRTYIAVQSTNRSPNGLDWIRLLPVIFMCAHNSFEIQWSIAWTGTKPNTKAIFSLGNRLVMDDDDDASSERMHTHAKSDWTILPDFHHPVWIARTCQMQILLLFRKCPIMIHRCERFNCKLHIVLSNVPMAREAKEIMTTTTRNGHLHATREIKWTTNICVQITWANGLAVAARLSANKSVRLRLSFPMSSASLFSSIYRINKNQNRSEIHFSLLLLFFSPHSSIRCGQYECVRLHFFPVRFYSNWCAWMSFACLFASLAHSLHMISKLTII